MTEPPVARFLAAAEPSLDDSDVSVVISHARERHYAVLRAVLESAGMERAISETGLDRSVLEAIQEDLHVPLGSLSLASAAELLALRSSQDGREIRRRIVEDVVVAMSRGPVDAATVADRYEFEGLRARLEGEEPLSLDEYVRLRVVLADLVAEATDRNA